MASALEIPIAERERARDAMTPRQRLLAALARQATDRVPISFKTINPFNPSNARLQTDSNYRLVTDLAARYTDVMHDWRVLDAQPHYSGSPDIRVEKVTSRDGLEVLTKVTTPEGVLTQIKRTIEGSAWELKPFLASERDLEIFFAHAWVPQRPDLRSFWREAEKVGENGLMRITHKDPIGMVAELLPRESLYVWMMERPELVDRLHETMFERLLDLMTYLGTAGVRCAVEFGGAEYAAPPMASPQLFDRYVGRFGPPLTELLKHYGCTPYLHCHARVGAWLERFATMGYVATHPVEPPPMGDVTPAEFKRRVGDRLALLGNVQIGEVLAGEPASIHAWVRDLIAVAGPGGGLIVRESASPWQTPMRDITVRNYMAMIEAAYRYGRYPLG
ncbi:MAG: hypothetical protein FJ029_02125 [Actinobacteria bacterium]|nr:hypothetical protein [Actinomycetota bacterium]